MEFTDLQQGILVNCWLLSRAGCGQVLEPWAYPDAVELEESGWLERRAPEHDGGPSSWWWSAQAEAALDMNQLVVESTRGREN